MKISYALLVSALACAAYAAPVEAGESSCLRLSVSALSRASADLGLAYIL
jgi:hypothetical protein